MISFSKSKESEMQEVIIDVKSPSQDNEDAEISAKEESSDYLNPFNQSYKKEKMEDEHFRDSIHKMSHQKVIADEK